MQQIVWDAVAKAGGEIDRVIIKVTTKDGESFYGTFMMFSGLGPPEEWLSVERDRAKRAPGGIEERFEHPLWRDLDAKARESGHGGMDYVMSWRLVQCLREGLAPDMDVYDAAAWSAPAALSEESVARGSAPVEFPDFTRGRWKGTPTIL